MPSCLEMVCGCEILSPGSSHFEVFIRPTCQQLRQYSDSPNRAIRGGFVGPNVSHHRPSVLANLPGRREFFFQLPIFSLCHING